MPRFFFHLREESLIPDPDGIEFADAAAARAAAVDGVRGLICDHSFEVEDGTGAPVFTVRFDEAVRIEP